MRFIKDLGRKEYGNQGQTKRYGLFECPACLELFELCTYDVKARKQKQCRSCHVSGIGFKKTHGMSCKRIYVVWTQMKARCLNKNSTRYHRYGGRGITICEEWVDSFDVFYSDMGDSPKGMEIDRINNDGNYEKSNCRWVTPAKNVRNSTVAKLTEEKVSVIKRLLLDKNYSQISLGILFDVTRSTIYRIKTGKIWTDIVPYNYPSMHV